MLEPAARVQDVDVDPAQPVQPCGDVAGMGAAGARGAVGAQPGRGQQPVPDGPFGQHGVLGVESDSRAPATDPAPVTAAPTADAPVAGTKSRVALATAVCAVAVTGARLGGRTNNDRACLGQLTTLATAPMVYLAIVAVVAAAAVFSTHPSRRRATLDVLLLPRRGPDRSDEIGPRPPSPSPPADS